MKIVGPFRLAHSCKFLDHDWCPTQQSAAAVRAADAPRAKARARRPRSRSGQRTARCSRGSCGPGTPGRCTSAARAVLHRCVFWYVAARPVAPRCAWTCSACCPPLRTCCTAMRRAWMPTAADAACARWPRWRWRAASALRARALRCGKANRSQAHRFQARRTTLWRCSPLEVYFAHRQGRYSGQCHPHSHCSHPCRRRPSSNRSSSSNNNGCQKGPPRPAQPASCCSSAVRCNVWSAGMRCHWCAPTATWHPSQPHRRCPGSHRARNARGQRRSVVAIAHHAILSCYCVCLGMATTRCAPRRR